MRRGQATFGECEWPNASIHPESEGRYSEAGRPVFRSGGVRSGRCRGRQVVDAVSDLTRRELFLSRGADGRGRMRMRERSSG